MTDIMAAIGLAQLRRYPSMLERRKHIVAMYNKALENMPVRVLNHYDDDHQSSGHLYLVYMLGKSVEERNRIIERMAEKNVATNVHYKPLPLLTAYKNLGFKIEDYPNAYDLYKCEITLPLHTKLTDEQAERVINTFAGVLKESNK